MTGAAWLAARAALAAGAGRVYVDVLAEAGVSHDALRPELMLRRGFAIGPPAPLAASLVICGCGGGESVRNVLPALLSHVPRLVLDADALNAIAADAQLQQRLRARGAHGHVTVLTPHPLEAARLLGLNTAQVQADRIAAATQIATAFDSVVVLKGSGTVVVAAQRTPSLNATGSAALASAGTGDVLAGWLGGHWSQLAVDGGVHARIRCGPRHRVPARPGGRYGRAGATARERPHRSHAPPAGDALGAALTPQFGLRRRRAAPCRFRSDPAPPHFAERFRRRVRRSHRTAVRRVPQRRPRRRQRLRSST